MAVKRAAVENKGYAVADGTQVHYRGTTYGPGESVPVPETPTADDATLLDQWVAAGWVTKG